MAPKAQDLFGRITEELNLSEAELPRTFRELVGIGLLSLASFSNLGCETQAKSKQDALNDLKPVDAPITMLADSISPKNFVAKGQGADFTASELAFGDSVSKASRLLATIKTNDGSTFECPNDKNFAETLRLFRLSHPELKVIGVTPGNFEVVHNPMFQESYAISRSNLIITEPKDISQ